MYQRNQNGEEPNDMEDKDETFETWEKLDQNGIGEQSKKKNGVPVAAAACHPRVETQPCDC
jgi:hypothetical protein